MSTDTPVIDTPVPASVSSAPRPPFSLDAISKLWLPILAAVYGSGYVIVSIYHSSLGLNEISPLRPQVAAAGVVFLASIAVAIFIRV
jgi:hypothetical protein